GGSAPRWADKGARDDTRAPRDDSRSDHGERPAYRGKPDGARSERPAYRGKPDSARGDRPGYSRPPTGDRKAAGDGSPTRWTDKPGLRRGSQPTRAERREREFAPRESEAKKRFGDDFDPERTPRKPRAKKSKDGKGSKGGDAGSSRRGKPRVKGPGKTAGPKKPKRG
ncbi:MAG TPA: hypothetical protein VFD20_05250, partial [Demequina sp.]|nr:hypothetical protein [Demequina sp.]